MIVLAQFLLSFPVAYSTLIPCEQQKLTAFDGGRTDLFGHGADVLEPWALIGAFQNRVPGINDGAAYLFEHVGESWSFTQKLIASDGEDGQGFGISVELTDESAIIGADGAHTLVGEFRGAAYVFQLVGRTWLETAKVFASDGGLGDNFGFATSGDGVRIAIGAPQNSEGFAGAGAVYMFVQSKDDWVLEEKIQAAAPKAFGHFGNEVAVDGLWLVVASEGEDDEAAIIHFFHRNQEGAQWTETQQFVVPLGVGIDIARRLDLCGNVCVFGVPDNRKAIVFRRQQDEMWRIEATVNAPPNQSGVDFGFSVRIGGGRMAIGQPSSDEFGPSAGAIHVFEDTGEDWLYVATLGTSDPDMNDVFGTAVGIDGDTLVGGANGDDQQHQDAGAAYVFDLECGEFAMLNSINVAYGTRISGGVQHVRESDDAYFHARSRFGFTAQEANLIDLRINATAPPLNAANTIDLIIESHLNHAGGTTRVQLRDWTAGNFETVHTYSPLTIDDTEFIENVPNASDYIRASDRRMQLALRQSVIITFTVSGFDSFTDFVSIEVEE